MNDLIRWNFGINLSFAGGNVDKYDWIGLIEVVAWLFLRVSFLVFLCRIFLDFLCNSMISNNRYLYNISKKESPLSLRIDNAKAYWTKTSSIPWHTKPFHKIYVHTDQQTLHNNTP